MVSDVRALGCRWEDGGIRHAPNAEPVAPGEAGQQEHAPDPRLRAWEEGRSGAGAFVPDERRIHSLAYEKKRSQQNGTSHPRASAVTETRTAVKGWQEMAAGSPRNTGYGPGNALWHTDSSFKLRGSLASILKSITVPESGGGQTEFASMRCAYRYLSAVQKAELEGLVGVHDFSFSNGLLIRKWAGPGSTPGQPPARHWLVRQTPGGPSLYVGRHLSHIEGMDARQGRRLVADLNRVCVQPQYTYAHSWTPGDLVICACQNSLLLLLQR
jgi:alpha-ketoglutarate-dependent taurine dioxygenase